MKLRCPAGAPCAYVTEEVDQQTALTLLEMHERAAHPNTGGGGGGNTVKKPEKFPRPQIAQDATAEVWEEFHTAWLQYKDEYSLTGTTLNRQLYACCSPSLATSLSRTTGGRHFELGEEQLLTQIKQLSVRFQNPAVNVQELLGMSQQQDEGIRSYLSRLRGVASRCEFFAECSCGTRVSYSDKVIRFKLIAGLVDLEIKEDILSMKDETLEETVKTIENKESGKMAKKTVGAVAPHGQVNVVKDDAGGGEHGRCSYCGRRGHGSGRQERENKCPAYNQTCNKCGRKGHFRAVCRNKKQQGSANEVQDENQGDNNQVDAVVGEASIMSMCASVKACSSLPPVPHMLYEQVKWMKKPPPGHPMIMLEVTVSAKSYSETGFTPPPATRRRDTDLLCLADTGCQACCMGPTQLYKLGMTERDLLVPELHLKAANTSGIDIIGALFVEIGGKDVSGVTRNTRQLCYVAKGIKHLLLSRETCERLGMIPSGFPTLGAFNSPARVGEVRSDIDIPEDPAVLPEVGLDITPCAPDNEGRCLCPRRSLPPEMPEFKEGATAEELKGIILNHYASSAFNRCTRQTLPLMKGDPLPIITDPAAQPVAVHSPIPVALHWEKKVKEDLDRDVALGVIEPVPINTPVTWCSKMIVVPKHDGSPRRTVDLQSLNKASVRQTFHTRTPFMLASDVPSGTVKSVLDVWNSYHSVPVVKEDRDKLTFLTPWGRFRYCVAPQGYLASGDGYTQRFTDITQTIENKRTIVDDSVIYSPDMRSNFYDVCRMLQIASEAGLIFNGDKFQFGQSKVDFAGLEITDYGVRPCRKFLEAIRNFPRPKNITEMRSFFGMINQVCYAFSMSNIMEPFRHLLRPGTQFIWSPDLQQSFEAAKEEIIKAVQDGVQHFEIDRHTCLATDWCKSGIGFFLLQKWCDCGPIHPRCCNTGWKLVLAGGRFTSPAESRYSPTEGELLAVVDALFKARHFVLGCSRLTVAVDHLPLLGILSDRSLADIDNPRLLLLKEKTLWFRFTTIHVPGKFHCGPDYMSRNAIAKEQTTKQARISCLTGLAMNVGSEEAPMSDGLEECIKQGTVAAIEALVVEAVTFDKIKEAVAGDNLSQELMEAIITVPYDMEFQGALKPFQRIRHGIHVVDGVPMYGQRVIVPKPMRQAVLEAIHSAHQSIGKMHDRALQCVYWPGLYSDLEKMRESCMECTRVAPSQPNLPPYIPVSPDYPFQMVVADFCDLKGKSWLVIADRFTGWISLHYFEKEATTEKVIDIFKTSFSTFGVAVNLSTDNDTRFRSHAFQDFLKLWGVSHRVSSDYNPHSNLRAETGIKTAKRILLDNTKSDGSPLWDKVRRAMMQHRNTPLNDVKLSPAQLVFGRPIRDFLPVKPDMFKPSEVWVDNAEKRELAMKKRLCVGLERWSEKTRPQSQLSPGQAVYIQNQRGVGKAGKRWDRSGVVLEDNGYDKYTIKVDGSGRVIDRNRRYLRSFTPENSQLLRGPNTQNQSSQKSNYVQEDTTPLNIPTLSVRQPSPAVEPAAPVMTGPPGGVEIGQNSDHVSTTVPENIPDTTVMSEPVVQLRRSTRVRHENSKYSKDLYDLSD